MNMNKYLILGDIHGKAVWKDIIAKENPDFVIFLGDYVTTHYNETAEEQVANLKEIFEYKQEHPDNTILLRGNHDLESLGYSWAECSGYDPKLHKLMEPLKEQYLELTQWLFPLQIEDNFFLFSHAGVSETWFYNVKDSTDITCIKDINTLEPSELFGFTPNNIFDYYGESTTQPCTWIRPSTLIEDMPIGITQIVGHTPVQKQCINLTEALRSRKEEGSKAYKKLETVPDLWLCDSLDNKSYLIIENGRPSSKIL